LNKLIDSPPMKFKVPFALSLSKGACASTSTAFMPQKVRTVQTLKDEINNWLPGVKKPNIFLVFVIYSVLVINPLPAYSQDVDWQRLAPNDPKSDELDLRSLHVTGASTYTARYRAHQFSTDAYKLMGIKVPPGSTRIYYIMGQCKDGASMIETQVDLVSSTGAVIHSDKSEVDFKATQTEFNGQYLKGTYQDNMESLACAALAAQCARRALRWPLPSIGNIAKPDDKNPLYGWMDDEAAPTTTKKETAKTTGNLSAQEEAKIRQLYTPDCRARLEQSNR
jgi:hypothetical protein